MYDKYLMLSSLKLTLLRKWNNWRSDADQMKNCFNLCQQQIERGIKLCCLDV